MTRLWQQPDPVTFVFWIAYTLCFLPEILGSLLQNADGSDQVRDRYSYPILVIGMFVSIFLAFTVSLSWQSATMTGHQTPMMIIGSAFMLAGAAFRWYAIRWLGRLFTRNVAIRPDHVIVQTGPYGTLRHPSYAGGLITMLGVGIALDNWASLALILAGTTAVYLYRMSVEEAALTAQFGDAYRQYCSKTKRIVPFVY